MIAGDVCTTPERKCPKLSWFDTCVFGEPPSSFDNRTAAHHVEYFASSRLRIFHNYLSVHVLHSRADRSDILPEIGYLLPQPLHVRCNILLLRLQTMSFVQWTSAAMITRDKHLDQTPRVALAHVYRFAHNSQTPSRPLFSRGAPDKACNSLRST